MSYDDLYDASKAVILTAIARTDDRATIAQVRNTAHDTTFSIFASACDEIRELPEVTLESVLFLFGQRP